MLPLSVESGVVRFGERFTLGFERTLRVPDDGAKYPLPPGLGRFEVHQVADYRDRVPARWRETGGVFIAMYQAEALWLSFDATPWKPSAVSVGVGGVNAISGAPWPGTLEDQPQNYLVCPPQLWLDGINAGRGFVRQFVAMPLGRGITVEGQLTGSEEHGGLQARVYEPRRGRFPDTAPAEWLQRRPGIGAIASASPMGFVPGGQIEQKVLQDPYGLDTWDPESFGTLSVHVLNSEQYRDVTGREPSPSPVNAHLYTRYGFPWFRLYEEEPDVPEARRFSTLSTLADVSDEARDERKPIEIRPSQVVDLDHLKTREHAPRKE